MVYRIDPCPQNFNSLFPAPLNLTCVDDSSQVPTSASEQENEEDIKKTFFWGVPWDTHHHLELFPLNI